MFRISQITVLIVFTSILGLAFAVQPTSADFGVSFNTGDTNPYGSYYGDRITSEYRRGYQTDDWVERGESSITESPVFSDGIRLAAWATRDENEYDYAIASAVYYFDVPSEARSVRIKIQYEGENDRDDVNDEIAGRVWIKRTTNGGDYEEYYPSEGRYESVDKPLYGDTFALPAKKRLEIIRTSAQDHVEDGIMELHVVAEGRQRIDVKYIEVETYSYMPTIRVITRYYKDYSWRPWNDYTYWYFYTGPVYHFSDFYYVQYTYPYYHTRYIEVRRNYDDYLRIYYGRNSQHHIRWDDVAIIHRGSPRHWDRDRLNRWTSDYDEARKGYNVVSTNTKRSVEYQRSRERVRSVLDNTSRKSPSALRASSTEVETRGSAVTEMKQRREFTGTEPRAIPDVRSRSVESRSTERTPIRTEKNSSSESSKIRKEESRSSIRVQTENNRVPEVRKAPDTNRSQEQQKPSQRNNEQIKKRSEATKENKSQEVRKPERVQRSEEKAPPKQEEVKKSDKTTTDDEEDKRQIKKTG
jgi:hypothetical protein